jgi:hypothetical protein
MKTTYEIWYSNNGKDQTDEYYNYLQFKRDFYELHRRNTQNLRGYSLHENEKKNKYYYIKDGVLKSESNHLNN